MISCYFLYFYLICSDIDCVMVRSQYFSSPCLAWPGLLIIRRISVPSGMSCLSEQQSLHGPVFVSCADISQSVWSQAVTEFSFQILQSL